MQAKKEEESEEEEEDEASKSENSDSESSSDGDKVSKKESGVEAELANPNRVVKKNKKVDELTTETPELSRREREEIEKQRAREHYQRLHAQGKTEEARADLARLAIIRQQREEAARKREEERKSKNKIQCMFSNIHIFHFSERR